MEGVEVMETTTTSPIVVVDNQLQGIASNIESNTITMSQKMDTQITEIKNQNKTMQIEIFLLFVIVIFMILFRRRRSHG